jgi:signal transduction histidine kinase
LEERDGSLLLQVKDNGRGISDKQLSDPHSLGLLGMRERAGLFGGEVSIVGVPDKGTTVRLSLPACTAAP